ncbi:hypothetical protein SCACP_07700 [Sporomusa carbonis]|uniref:glycerol dehydratase reactivase beta/small subunit family protein n=1 Tax=Sporomusa carbonis TaxID=3076075 RepID=UPI003A7942F7
MMQPDKTLTKPSIIVCTFPHANCDAKLRELQAGMEEEGIPYSLLNGDRNDAVALAYQGAQASPLGVGVGISPAGMCIHYHKLPALQPLFTLTGEGTAADWRQFGYNAARLVKGLPFKDKPEQNTAPDLDMAQLYESVRKIVLKALPEFVKGHGEVNTWSKTH